MNLSFVKKVCRKALITSGKYVADRYRREVFHVSNMSQRASEIAEMSGELMTECINSMMPVKASVIQEGYTRLTVSSGEIILVHLDGKEGFVFGQPNYSIAAVYIEGGKSALAGVFNPYFKELFFAERGKPLKRNNQQARVNDIALLTDSFLGYSFRGDYNNLGQRQINTLFSLMRQPVRAMIPGSDLYGLSLVANGNLSGMIMAAPNFFIVQPGLFVVEEAGGRVTDEQGNPPSERSEFIIATNKTIHNETLKQLQQIIVLERTELNS